MPKTSPVINIVASCEIKYGHTSVCITLTILFYLLQSTVICNIMTFHSNFHFIFNYHFFQTNAQKQWMLLTGQKNTLLLINNTAHTCAIYNFLWSWKTNVKFEKLRYSGVTHNYKITLQLSWRSVKMWRQRTYFLTPLICS